MSKAASCLPIWSMLQRKNQCGIHVPQSRSKHLSRVDIACNILFWRLFCEWVSQWSIERWAFLDKGVVVKTIQSKLIWNAVPCTRQKKTQLGSSSPPRQPHSKKHSRSQGARIVLACTGQSFSLHSAVALYLVQLQLSCSFFFFFLTYSNAFEGTS